MPLSKLCVEKRTGRVHTSTNKYVRRAPLQRKWLNAFGGSQYVSRKQVHPLVDLGPMTACTHVLTLTHIPRHSQRPLLSTDLDTCSSYHGRKASRAGLTARREHPEDWCQHPPYSESADPASRGESDYHSINVGLCRTFQCFTIATQMTTVAPGCICGWNRQLQDLRQAE